jgi:TonB family protein
LDYSAAGVKKLLMKFLSLENPSRMTFSKKDLANHKSRTILATGLGGSVVLHLGLFAGITHWWQPVALDDAIDITLVEPVDVAEFLPPPKIEPPVPITEPKQTTSQIEKIVTKPPPISKSSQPDTLPAPEQLSTSSRKPEKQQQPSILLSPRTPAQTTNENIPPQIKETITTPQLTTKFLESSPLSQPAQTPAAPSKEFLKQLPPNDLAAETSSVQPSPPPTLSLTPANPSSLLSKVAIPTESSNINPSIVRASPLENTTPKLPPAKNNLVVGKTSLPQNRIAAKNSPASLLNPFLPDSSQPNSGSSKQPNQSRSNNDRSDPVAQIGSSITSSASPAVEPSTAGNPTDSSRSTVGGQVAPEASNKPGTTKPGLQCIKNCELTKLQDLQDSDGGKDRLRIRIVVNANGLVLESAIAKSSGNPQIDAAVLEGIKQMQFAPPGKIIRGTVKANIFI